MSHHRATARLMALAAGAAVALTALTAPVVEAAPEGGGCRLDSVATFAPHGPGTNMTYTYKLRGTLTMCQSNIAGAPKAGTAEVGQIVTKRVRIKTTRGYVWGTAKYAEPLATAKGILPGSSCASGQTAGKVIARWTGAGTTVMSYTTTDVGPGVGLRGKVIDAVTLKLVARSARPAGTAPSTYIERSTNKSFRLGSEVGGLLAFTTDDPVACTTAAGLSKAEILGTVIVGSAP